MDTDNIYIYVPPGVDLNAPLDIDIDNIKLPENPFGDDDNCSSPDQAHWSEEEQTEAEDLDGAPWWACVEIYPGSGRPGRRWAQRSWDAPDKPVLDDKGNEYVPCPFNMNGLVWGGPYASEKEAMDAIESAIVEDDRGYEYWAPDDTDAADPIITIRDWDRLAAEDVSEQVADANDGSDKAEDENEAEIERLEKELAELDRRRDEILARLKWLRSSDFRRVVGN